MSGKPRKPVEKRPAEERQYTLRFQGDAFRLYAILEASAKKDRRSLNAQIIHMLEKQLRAGGLLTDPPAAT